MVQNVSGIRFIRRLGLRFGSLALTLAFVVSGLIHPGSAAAAQYAPGDVLEVDTPALNVRAGAGTGNSVVDVLSGGTQVTIVDGPVAQDGDTWYEIASPSGWLIGEGLAPMGDDGDPGDTPGGSDYAPGTNLVVTTDALNLRSMPDLQGDVLAALPNGTAAVVVTGNMSVMGTPGTRSRPGARPASRSATSSRLPAPAAICHPATRRRSRPMPSMSASTSASARPSSLSCRGARRSRSWPAQSTTRDTPGSGLPAPPATAGPPASSSPSTVAVHPEESVPVRPRS